MPPVVPVIFAFSSVWIGNYGAGVKLTRVLNLRTNGIVTAEDFPTEYVRSIDNSIQSGNWTFRVGMTFYTDKNDKLPEFLSRGLAIDGSRNDVPRNSQYALLLVSPDGSDSIYVPKCRTEKKGRSKTANKTSAQSVTVNLIAESPSVWDPQASSVNRIYYEDDVTTLASSMGTLYPL